MWLFSYCASCNLAIPFQVDCYVKFHPFSNNKHNNFQYLSAYLCILLIHLDNVHFENRLVINARWQCFLWKICRLLKLEIHFGVLFSRTCLIWTNAAILPIRQYISVKFYLKFKSFHSRKCTWKSRLPILPRSQCVNSLRSNKNPNWQSRSNI